MPVERAETIPSAWYTESRFLDLEMEAVFKRHWQYINHACRLQQPGDFIIGTVGRSPVIVVRDGDGGLRGFYNVCRHRGGPLATEDGHGSVLKCRYHGWTYRLDGSLRGVPHFDRVELFDKGEYGLVAVNAAEHDGLVLVSPGAAHSVQTVVRGIGERIAPCSLATKKFFKREVYEIECNWKVYMDNYLEGYHVPHVHPELFSLYDFQNYVTFTDQYYSVQVGEFSTGGTGYNPTGEPAYYFAVFPNFMLNITPGRLQTNLVLPVDHRHTRVVFDYYYDDTESDEARARIDADIDFADRVQLEDIEICEHVQRGLESGAYDRGRFSVKFEEGLYHFQSLLRRSYRLALGRGDD